MYQLRKLAARHRGGVAAAGAIASLLVALAVTMVVQAQRVRRERDRATAEAAKASAINAFLQDALGAADPWSKGSRNVTLLDALRQAQDKAKTSFGNQPLVEASVLQTIGTTFANLAEFPEAEKAFRAALDLRVRPRAAGAPRPPSRSGPSRGCTPRGGSSTKPRSTPVRPSRSRAGSRREEPRGGRRDERSRDRALRFGEAPRRRKRSPRRCSGSCGAAARSERRESAKAETDALLILIRWPPPRRTTRSSRS